ncbi:MAG TPA: hypothetical protein PKH07_08550 [bacterium]|nr:hypothetical protein [bacterium]
MDKLDFTRIKTVPIASRESKVRLEDLAQVPRPGASFAEFFNSLPSILKVQDLRLLVAKIAEAVRDNKPRIVLFGAHLIKCGLSPYLVEGMKRGIWTTLATNGAGSIHDFEIAIQGATSEDVGKGLADGTFGMAEETGRWMNEAIREGAESGLGFGEALARKMESLQLPYRHHSVVYQAMQTNVPMCVHVALGTDIIHQHPEASGSAIGETSFRDFRKLTECVAELKGGGVVLNLGSAVILPEVFLKALTVARNLVDGVHGFTTANFDMLQTYRPHHNVVSRPTETGGIGLSFIGHHELLLPLFFYAVFEACKSKSQLF